ncbi:hypothetical protein [Candidatus Odyssella acanthamoebae]|uniref:Uncharacterized protein n=1 Tax=Candidatus Odyssella acanthamoebae TaxID=91604 RepID=A0A077AVU7_9PROT|nr:hypothetical protein [Candidatus Paracaedibacter acanthamoebae]AIK96511.1 hypothetical protein ID47_06790 [Candidatus Paracaedibacter acanthamoebae]
MRKTIFLLATLLIFSSVPAEETASTPQGIIPSIEEELVSPPVEIIMPSEEPQDVISSIPEEITTTQPIENISSTVADSSFPSHSKSREKKKHKRTREIVNEEEDIVYISWPEFLLALTESRQKSSLAAENFDPENIPGCCCFPKSCCTNCYGKMNVASRIFWTFAQGGTGALASLSHYARRSIIPLVTLGNFDKKTRDYLLLCIAIFQGVGDMSETIHDYAIIKAIQIQKNLKKLEKLYKSEKQRQKLKALAKCAEGSLPNLRIHQKFPLKELDRDLLYKLYYPKSLQMSDLTTEMKRLTELTLLEEIYFMCSDFLWTDTYPLFWLSGTALGLIQLFLIISDLALQDEPSLKISIIMLVIEALQYLSLSMKYDSEQKTFETHKFRKDLAEIDNPENDSSDDTELQEV